MKTIILWVSLAQISFGFIPLRAQSTFQNLDFEAGTLVPIPGEQNNRFYLSDAFPGWTGYAGTDQITGIFYNAASLASASISLFSRDGDVGNNVIAGRYTTLFHAGGASGSFVDTSIAQVGLVPADAFGVRFKAQGINFTVSFAGQNIPFSAIGGGPNYTLYDGDISAFAGQVGELRFTSLTTASNPYNGMVLDDIAFVAVPEPSVLGLLSLGALVLGFVRWQSCRRK